MDVQTQEEVVMTGDALATKEYLQKLATDKLMRQLEKKGLLK